MTLYQMRQMTLEKLEEIMFDIIVNDFEVVANIKEGHSDIHVGLTDLEMINSSISDNKNSVSSFYDHDVLDRAVRACLIESVKDICYWQKNSRENKLELHCNVEEFVGDGFSLNRKNNEFRKYATKSITVVLERDMQSCYIGGFCVLTAYPDLSKGERTNEHYTIDWALKKLEGSINKLDELSLYIRTNYPGLRVQKMRIDDVETLRVIHKGVYKDYVAYVNIFKDYENFVFKERSVGQSETKKDLYDLKKKNYDLFTALRDIRSKTREYREEIKRQNEDKTQNEYKKKIIIVSNKGTQKNVKVGANNKKPFISENKNKKNIKNIDTHHAKLNNLKIPSDEIYEEAAKERNRKNIEIKI